MTLGPKDGGEPSWPAYEGKHSLNFKMPKGTPILAPLDMWFLEFKNRSAEYRQVADQGERLTPFDDLELCFESVSDDRPGLVPCVYRLSTTPLFQAHLDDVASGIQERWDGGGAEAGRIYYLSNSTERDWGPMRSSANRFSGRASIGAMSSAIPARSVTTRIPPSGSRFAQTTGTP